MMDRNLERNFSRDTGATNCSQNFQENINNFGIIAYGKQNYSA